MGIDASLSGCGLVAIPLHWKGDWSHIAHKTIGYSLPSGASDHARIDRLARLASGALEFAQQHQCTIAAIESYPFGKVTAAHALGEASGCIKVALRAAGIEVRVAPISTARKLLLGHLPRAGAKLAVRDHLIGKGAPFRTLDECDAFAAAHWLLRERADFTLPGAA